LRKTSPFKIKRSRKSVLIDDIAPNVFKVLQFIVLLKKKERDPIQNVETKENIFLCFFVFYSLSVFLSYAKKPFPEVVNLVDRRPEM